MNYFDYFKSALLSQLNIVWLAGISLFSIVSWNWLPFIIGGLIEAAYLIVIPPSPWYHRRLEQKSQKEKSELIEREKNKVLNALPQEDREQYLKLVRACDETKKNYQSLHPATQTFLEAISTQLDRLLSRYLMMRQAYVQSTQYLSNTPLQELKDKVMVISNSIQQGDERIREVQEKQKTILEQRLEKRSKVDDNSTILRTQLDTIEQFILLMKDQSLTLRDPDEVTGQIDSMMNEVQSTESTVKELEGFFKENE